MPPFDHLSSFLQQHKCNRWAMAVSGGADSMAMLILVKQYATLYHSTCHALIVDHQLRPDSSDEASYVGQLCADLSIPHTILQWQHPPVHTNIQEKARNARYSIMANWCMANRFDHLMTAHHADDVLETFMMRLGKGSSLMGLMGMAPIRRMHNITIIRPFLHVAKDELHEVLKDQAYVQDPSNDNVAFERVRIRQWLHQMPDLSKGFVKAYPKLQKIDQYLQQQAQIFIHTYQRGCDFPLEALLALDPVIFERVIKNYVLDDFVMDTAIDMLRHALENKRTMTLNHKKFEVINDKIVRISHDGRNGGI